MIETTRIANNTDYGFRYVVNQMACAAICVYMTLPYFRSLAGLYGLILAFGGWLITTDLKWLASKWPKDIIALAVFFGTFIPYVITNRLGYGMFGIKTLTVMIPIFFLGIFINHYYAGYKHDYNSLGKIALVSLLGYLVGSLQTYFGLLSNPNASRALAGSIGDDAALRALYERLGIGGFGYVYAGCFVLIAAAYPLLKKSGIMSKRYWALSVAAVIVMFLMIVRSSYSTALILTLTGIVLARLVKNRGTFAAVMVGTALFMLLFPQELLGQILLKTAGIFSENQIVYSRLVDLATSFFPDSGGVESLKRVDLYLTSLKTFAGHPLFGIYGPFGGNLDPTSYYVIGAHSGWFDLLGFYGLFAGIPMFFVIFFNIRKQFDFFKNDRHLGLMLVTSFLFVLLGAINPLITVYEIGFAQFCIVPAIPFLRYAFIPNAKRLAEEEEELQMR